MRLLYHSVGDLKKWKLLSGRRGKSEARPKKERGIYAKKRGSNRTRHRRDATPGGTPQTAGSCCCLGQAARQRLQPSLHTSIKSGRSNKAQSMSRHTWM